MGLYSSLRPQKTLSLIMSSFLQQEKLSKKSLSAFLKTCLNLTLLIAMSAYLSIRIIFFEIRFPIAEEVFALIQVLFAATIVGIFIFGFLLFIEWIDQHMKSKQIAQSKLKASKLAAIAILSGIIILNSCGMPNVGVKKDMSSGLTTTYTGITMESAALIMNDQEIHHNNIPLGQSFLVVNENVKGLVEKDGKVSIGCLLLISDENGNKVLNEADLFKGNDLYNKNDVKLLRCTVNTGQPMEKEKKYDVVVRFWDKFGAGKIENKVAIRMVD